MKRSEKLRLIILYSNFNCIFFSLDKRRLSWIVSFVTTFLPKLAVLIDDAYNNEDKIFKVQ